MLLMVSSESALGQLWALDGNGRRPVDAPEHTVSLCVLYAPGELTKLAKASDGS